MTPKQFIEILKEELRPIIEATVGPMLKEALKPIIETQEKHSTLLEEHSKILGEHSKILGEHSKILGEHSKILGEHSKTLGKHSKTLEEQTKENKSISTKIDDIIAELHEVHQLARATSDIVKARYEKNKREIDEIKDHLGLPKLPYFGE